MNVLTSGQLRTFLPVTPLSRTGLTVLRPLLYYREAEIIDMVRQLDLQPLRNPCPYDGHTKRQDIKEHIRELEKLSPESTTIWPPLCAMLPIRSCGRNS